ncbi:MAG: hypothetical protein SNJ70_11280, partial [Armatimonadota bacterium]
LSASDDCIVRNNKIINGRQGIILHGMPRKDYDKKYTLKNNLVEENLKINTQKEDIIIFAGEDSEGNKSDKNIFINERGKFISSDTWSGKYFSLSQWQEQTSHDINSKFFKTTKQLPSAEEAFVEWLKNRNKQ